MGGDASGVGGAVLPPERDYLLFDGTTSFAYADGGAVGFTPATGSYSLVTKVFATPNSGADSYMTHLSNPLNVAPAGANITDVLRRVISTGQRYSIIGLTSAGANNYARASNSEGVTAVNTPAVYMLGRDLTANTARGRVVGADGVIRWTFTDIAVLQDSVPQDVIWGVAANHLFVPFAGTYYGISWVATLVFYDYTPSDAELQAYALPTCQDAREIWPTRSFSYWTATRLRGRGAGPIPPVRGLAPMTLVGLDDNDLVPL